MPFLKTLRTLTMALAALPFAAQAGDAGTLYTQLSTNGVGIGYAKSVSEDWALRGQYNFYRRTYSDSIGDFGANATLDVVLDMSSLQLLGDWYPGSSGLRLTGGLVLNNNRITAVGVGTVNGKVGATVNGEIKMSDSVAPYLGIGYASKPQTAKGWGLNFDLGVMFQSPKSSLSATGPGVTQADVDAQNAKVQVEADKLKTMPVIGIGLSYSF